MTAENAIKQLKRMAMDKDRTGDEVNALTLAIKALDQCEVWNSMKGQMVAPKGTFEKIFFDKEDEE